jgi:dipeptidyl aminopeptidase/acylaminoacyl peptidase
MLAQHIDIKNFTLRGEPVRLGSFSVSTFVGLGGASISADGRIAYRASGDAPRRLTWLDRNGKAAGFAGEPDTTALFYPELSPDGRQVAVDRSLQGNSDIWVIDVLRGTMTRLTFDPSIDLGPVWSPDGNRIAYASLKKDHYAIYIKPSNGAGAEQLLLEGTGNQYPQDWSKDGRFLLYSELDPKRARSLWALPVAEGDRKPIAVATGTSDSLNGQFSPDGRWVAYQSNESGEFQIVVQPFPQPGGKWQISMTGGTQPRWRSDGKELYFIAADGKLMAASVTANGSTFAAGTPVALFPAAAVTGIGLNKHEYAVSPDGRFLINQLSESSTTAPITVVLNWSAPK